MLCEPGFVCISGRLFLADRIGRGRAYMCRFGRYGPRTTEVPDVLLREGVGREVCRVQQVVAEDLSSRMFVYEATEVWFGEAGSWQTLLLSRLAGAGAGRSTSRRIVATKKRERGCAAATTKILVFELACAANTSYLSSEHSTTALEASRWVRLLMAYRVFCPGTKYERT